MVINPSCRATILEENDAMVSDIGLEPSLTDPRVERRTWMPSIQAVSLESEEQGKGGGSGQQGSLRGLVGDIATQ